jgi:hypothetical protein
MCLTTRLLCRVSRVLPVDTKNSGRALISCFARSVSPIFLSKQNLHMGAASGVDERFRRAEPELLTASHPGGIGGVVVGLGL